ncbi:CDP-diacylglycerol--serine O-phosphatidyltransferase [Candidatus Bandiella euplotis]|uniref:CDP-diacylglycerol--serine O-phosphatidyltransferase n=1 Tax=Candidatus Bandiella euplotis TaxID=1664265 RepID=A0ABZ0ULP2_9RICK|nr:CDP-diacylglycerol--serine O-phosphatidyltransferase [Candidatus Bandiella woodruffii]WPX97056.1 PssA superfamily CDP-alcohol phosphatidyltransferase [Candidatus Bandiella woodruffii]
MSKTTKKLTIPIQKLIPSIVTILALCLGITSIRYSLDGKFHIAVALIAVAAFFDGIDGRIARLLNSTSEFGAQLDSLADLCSFGVAPGLAVYLWSLKMIPYKGAGWAIVLFYITCSALRLARFNVQASLERQADKERNDSNFFVGVPMPVAAGLLLVPMMFTFEILEKCLFIASYWFVAPYMVLIGFLMVSRLPIYSAKKINISKEKVNIILVIIGMIFTGIILEPWILLPIIGICYIILIPVGVYFYYKKKGKSDAE